MSENPNDHDEKTRPAPVDPATRAPGIDEADATDPAFSDTTGVAGPTGAAHAERTRPLDDRTGRGPEAEPTEMVAPAPISGPVIGAGAAPIAPVTPPAIAEPVAANSDAPQYAPTPQYQQPERVFVPPLPLAPKKKGNRGIGSLIAVLSAVIFALGYAIVAGIIIAVRAPSEAVEVSLRFLADTVFFVPAILFVIGFVLVILLVNRSGWWAHVIGSLFVAAVVYFGTIGFQLLAVGGLGLTPGEAAARFAAYAASPFVIAAALVARETALWIGAVIASRGRRMKTRNAAARADFDRATAEHRAEYERAYAPVS